MGSFCTILKFVKTKIRGPIEKFRVSVYFASYLTVGFEFLIGAEIIKASILKTWDELVLLVLVVVIRGLLGFISYMEGKWGAQEEEYCTPRKQNE